MKVYFSSIDTVTFHFHHQAQLYLANYIHQLLLFDEFALFTPISYNVGYLDYNLKVYCLCKWKKPGASNLTDVFPTFLTIWFAHRG